MGMSKKARRWTILGGVALVIAGFFVFRWWKAKQNELPEGIASGNGRIESKAVDVSSKLPLKVKEVKVAEGDLVRPGQVVAQMDTITLEAELAAARLWLAPASCASSVIVSIFATT